MGRSKFPGKPTKHVNRTRINVLPATSEGIIECCSSVTVKTVAENKQVNKTQLIVYKMKKINNW